MTGHSAPPPPSGWYACAPMRHALLLATVVFGIPVHFNGGKEIFSVGVIVRVLIGLAVVALLTWYVLQGRRR
jgi:hypothetical protein